LLFYDPVRPAIGLTHAGWRGTMKNAAGATVQAMIKELSCKADDIIAVIGPAIGPCCYEVGAEVIDTAADAFSDSESLFHHNGKAGHAHFDMWEANRRQLIASGVKQIVGSNLCTACHTDQFFSHRAENGKTGRFGVMMGLRGIDQ
jgi:YfiH family protein